MQHSSASYSRSMDQSPIQHQRPPNHNTTHLSNAALTEIQLELELLKERRRALEQQRRLLLETPPPSVAAAHGGATYNASQGHHTISTGRTTSPSSARSQSTSRSRSGPNNASNRSRSEHGNHAMDHHRVIPTEKERRDTLPPNIYQQMKEAMRRSWDHDSTLVGGCFNIRDNPQNSTFGRERRFLPVNGTKGTYFLATDVQHMQNSAKQSGRQRHLTASSRGGPGCNVQSNWNDSRGGSAPGPGAYTPRYQKLAKPSILSQK